MPNICFGCKDREDFSNGLASVDATTGVFVFRMHDKNCPALIVTLNTGEKARIVETHPSYQFMVSLKGVR